MDVKLVFQQFQQLIQNRSFCTTHQASGIFGREASAKPCPHCNGEMNLNSDRVLGVNFDGSFYIKRPVTLRACTQCNYLQR